MRYESLNVTSLNNIKIKNISKVAEFQYSIEKINLGKKYQSQYIVFIIKHFYNYIVERMKLLNRKNNNIIYKNEINREIYSKFWWNI
tara:strand:- start:7498 stop:7758 length:261 start_codon:yes stop_codon:yes gene_type:complete